MLGHAQYVLHGGSQQYALSDLPSLLIVERDARPPTASVDPAAARQLPSPAALEYALLEPRGDATDATRQAVRSLFFNRSLVQMDMPDATDLEALSVGELPPTYAIPGLRLSGPRQFYASFEQSAEKALSMLKPKTLGGFPLPGRELAAALASIVPQLNRDEPARLHRAVYASLRHQANEAVNAGVRSGIDALRATLLPQLAAASTAASAESADEASEADGERLPGVSFRTLAEVSEGEGEEGETADPPLRQLEFDSRQSVSVVRSVLYVKIKSFSFRLLA